jgi:hypothetical protein
MRRTDMAKKKEKKELFLATIMIEHEELYQFPTKEDRDGFCMEANRRAGYRVARKVGVRETLVGLDSGTIRPRDHAVVVLKDWIQHNDDHEED